MTKSKCSQRSFLCITQWYWFKMLVSIMFPYMARVSPKPKSSQVSWSLVSSCMHEHDSQLQPKNINVCAWMILLSTFAKCKTRMFEHQKTWIILVKIYTAHSTNCQSQTFLFPKVEYSISFKTDLTTKRFKWKQHQYAFNGSRTSNLKDLTSCGFLYTWSDP